MRLALAGLAICAAGLAACSPGLPEGVDEAKVHNEISSAIGDPNTCVLIGQQGTGKVVYRYNSHTTCGRSLPACQGAAAQTVDDLLKATAQDRQPRATSCNSTADGSRGVGWASGVLTGKGQGLVYAAVMEGERSFPGRMMSDRLSRALQDAGL
ncbi:hypothetical protein [Phenylobacterium deserti]|uniref:Lipoprotein n=1 Tax=Phenylobacterium deserti TaxID=1914756 RepID=A0A328AAC8_9CAUL|nr:hypothetical protein [Phenylobacterium deserti]RAK51377.1 hypothetical protein DJ018_15680 [Phenylobacterium deserti]